MSTQYKLNIHAYCIMNNHYHILMETSKTNISDAIKFLNSSYANYFNKKHKRSGHLWQGRFFSNYLFDDEHFWIIAKYIEQNPRKANIVSKIDHYPHQSFYQYAYKSKYFSIIKNSKILEMKIEDYHSFIDSPMSKNFEQKVYTEPKRLKDQDGNYIVLSRRIETFFEEDRDINKIINVRKAFDYGYSKAEIAGYLGMSNSIIAKYLK